MFGPDYSTLPHPSAMLFTYSLHIRSRPQMLIVRAIPCAFPTLSFQMLRIKIDDARSRSTTLSMNIYLFCLKFWSDLEDLGFVKVLV